MALPASLAGFRIEGTASTNQADCKFGENAGAQCLSNCIIYLMSSYFNNEAPITETHDLNKVLKFGAELDSNLRKLGLLSPGQYAQLDHVPCYVQTRKWSGFIYTSAEMFGLLGMPADISDSCITSLRDLLTANYSNTIQYILYICGQKSGAIIIQGGRYTMFDPHCLKDIPESPAHVLSTSDPDALIKYVGGVSREYTACFLYFVPGHISPKNYIMSHYKVISFSDLHGSKIILEEYDLPTTNQSFCSSPQASSSPDPEVGSLLKYMSKAKRKRYPMSCGEEWTDANKKRKESGRTPPEKMTHPLPSPDIIDLTMDDDVIDLTGDDDMEDESEGDREAEPDRSGTSLPSVTLPNLAAVDQLLNSLTLPGHVPSFPALVDTDTGESYRLTRALHQLKNVLQQVLEIGVVSDSDYTPTEALNVLNYLMAWSKQLQIKNDDIKLLINSNLQIEKLFTLLKNNLISDPNLADHVQAKVCACLPAMHANRATDLQKILLHCKNLTRALEISKSSLDIKDIITTFTESFPQDFFCVCSVEEANNLVSTVQDLKRVVSNNMALTSEQDARFKALMLSVLNNTDPPASLGPIYLETETRTPLLSSAIQEAVKAIEKDTVETLSELISNIPSENAIETTFVPPVRTLLKNVTTLLTVINACVERAEIRTPEIDSSQQQLSYIGRELSKIIDETWPERAFREPVHVLDIFQKTSSHLNDLKKKMADSESLDKILSEINQTLKAIQDKAASPALINTLSDYIKNATVLAQASDPRLVEIQSQVTTLTTSTSYIESLLQKINIRTLPEVIPQLQAATKTEQGQLSLAAMNLSLIQITNSLINEALSSIHARSHNHLSNTFFNSLNSLMGLADIPGREDLIKTMESIMAVQEELVDCDDMECVEKGLTTFKYIKSSIRQYKFDKSFKTKIYLIITSEVRDLTKIKTDKQLEAWKQDVADFTPASIDDLNLFLDKAPTKTARSYATRQLKHFRDDLIKEQEMETETTPVPSTAEIERAIDLKIKATWDKILTNLRDLTFHHIAPGDWQVLLTVFNDHKSALFTKMGGELLKALQGLTAYVDSILTPLLASQLPQGQRYVAPNSDWVETFDQNVKYYLRTFHLPRVSEQLDDLERKTLLLTKLVKFTDLSQSLIGTHLEKDWSIYQKLFNSLLTVYNDHLIKTKTEVHAFLDKIASDPLLEPQAHPDLQKITQLFTEQEIIEINTLPDIFKESIKNNEKHYIASYQTEMKVFTSMVDAALAKKTQSTTEYNTHLLKIVNNMLVQAPPYAASHPISSDAISYITSLVRDKHLLEKLSYAESLKNFNWLSRLITIILTNCHPSHKQHLQTLLDEILSREQTLTPLVALEDNANQSPTERTLQAALTTLNVERVLGRATTFQKWKSQLQELEEAVKTTTQVSLLIQTISSLHDKTVTEMDPTILSSHSQALADKLKELLALKPSLDETTMSLFHGMKAYAQFKHYFVQHYVITQPKIFDAYPLSHHGTVSSSGGHQATKFNPLMRLKAFSMVTDVKKMSVWREINTTVDPTGHTFIPAPPTPAMPPIHYNVLFSSFLQAEAINLALNSNQPPTKKFGLLPGLMDARVGVQGAMLLDNQWNDISTNSAKLLDHYVRSELTPNSLTNSQFAAMTVFAHAMAMVTPHINSTRATIFPSKAIVLNQLQFLKLCLTMWPKFSGGLLRAPSFERVVQLARATLPTLLLSAPRNTLNHFLANNYRPTDTLPNTEALLFYPNQHPLVNLEKLLLTSSPFHALSTSVLNTRISMLVWGILSLSEAVLQQLWDSLYQESATFTTYIDLLRHLSAMNHKNSTLTTSTSLPQNNGPVVYSYGHTAGTTVATLEGSHPLDDGGQNIPMTLFEFVIFTIILKLKFHVFYTQEKALVNTQLGPLHLITHALDGTGDTEPFKTYISIPPQKYNGLGNLQQFCSQDEIQIFQRQHEWLVGVTKQTSFSNEDLFIVLASADNKVLSVHTFNPPINSLESETPEIVAAPIQESWPKEITTVSFWDKPALEKSPQELITEVSLVAEIFSGSAIFNTFPPSYKMVSHTPSLHVETHQLENLSITEGTPPTSPPLPDSTTQDHMEEPDNKQAKPPYQMTSPMKENTSTSGRPARSPSPSPPVLTPIKPIIPIPQATPTMPILSPFTPRLLPAAVKKHQNGAVWGHSGSLPPTHIQSSTPGPAQNTRDSGRRQIVSPVITILPGTKAGADSAGQNTSHKDISAYSPPPASKKTDRPSDTHVTAPLFSKSKLVTPRPAAKTDTGTFGPLLGHEKPPVTDLTAPVEPGHPSKVSPIIHLKPSNTGDRDPHPISDDEDSKQPPVPDTSRDKAQSRWKTPKQRPQNIFPPPKHEDDVPVTAPQPQGRKILVGGRQLPSLVYNPPTLRDIKTGMSDDKNPEPCVKENPPGVTHDPPLRIQHMEQTVNSSKYNVLLFIEKIIKSVHDHSSYMLSTLKRIKQLYI
ncbi:tegument protein [Murine herpesvirus strain 4556]|uniref:Tegument protein n=1 Tax=Murine herpesvirus TaxID=1431748 RepID=A0A6M4EKA8_9BETA|nr:tegument protein [Murine herpesvirus]QJQ80322.1 tegument protein [Murine herpesvirus]UNZ86693.1 tegument protein [Murine herpesvirus strain 72]UNZ86770.1 tegument protein [Murine herpesvirus strain 4556]